MALILHLHAQWPDRVVHVRCAGMPALLDRYRSADKPVAIDHADVKSLEAFRGYLVRITKGIDDGGSVAVLGFESEIRTILRLLDVQGPPPDPVIVMMDAA